MRGLYETKAGIKSRYTVLSHLTWNSFRKKAWESYLVSNCDTQAAHHSWHGGEDHSASVHRHLNTIRAKYRNMLYIYICTCLVSFPAFKAGLRIRIRIGSGFNRVSESGSGSRRAKMTHKSRKKLRNTSGFEVLDVLFWELKASSVP